MICEAEPPSATDPTIWPRLDPDARVEDLPVRPAATVEIVKVSHRGARILILDEPTGVLTAPGVVKLFRVLRGLVQSGKTIFLSAINLKKSLRSPTGSRSCAAVGVAPSHEDTTSGIARLMVARLLLRVERRRQNPDRSPFGSQSFGNSDRVPGLRGVLRSKRTGESRHRPRRRQRASGWSDPRGTRRSAGGHVFLG